MHQKRINGTAALDSAIKAPDSPTFARLLRESGCRRCALAALRTHIVVNRGSPRAAVVAIGEAPGEQEDLAGRAFIGRARRVRAELLRAVCFDPEADVFIVNIVKCPPWQLGSPRR